ncbi:hypothetical protein HKO46_02850 [Streptococcus equi subsp. zooepidemicus]|uniref:hypothetical protein n=1 Tax=Streptococcus equi TaxID=1336 RepID=UPI0002175AE7|nr:hypothetical protein [Streptococcus equi]AEJ26059.1 conserved hypothetical protein [Streptococcus equi subsp. zooepidemicus ATCC 35246]AIA68517.1 hypothetical protein Q426_00205 [Streptococcus equi subsp. zooepidemicus CY]MBR7683824.1 hypothetical protein [Streptococcus equi subsp. zooepidemicus]MBR7752671.1 hypothetical protein [Streptococcus equi subsp. zooepidemicus]MBR7775701.1 hypothetical protein [Streptococcus equi subsp. zooepidemicus]
MITKEMMTTTEMILMTYLFEIDEWLKDNKVIQQKQAQLTKEELVTVIKNDLTTFQADQVTDYEKELQTTLKTLESLPEAQFQKMKLDMLSWEPTVKHVD